MPPNDNPPDCGGGGGGNGELNDRPPANGFPANEAVEPPNGFPANDAAEPPNGDEYANPDDLGTGSFENGFCASDDEDAPNGAYPNPPRGAGSPQLSLVVVVELALAIGFEYGEDGGLGDLR